MVVLMRLHGDMLYYHTWTMSTAVIARRVSDEAIQLFENLDCFASLAMTP